MKRLIILSMITILLLSIGLAIAKPEKVHTNVNPSNGHASVNIPAHAVQLAPGIFSLGSAVDAATGKVVEGIMFVYKKGDAKPPWAGGGDKGGKGKSSCYQHMAKGAKWKTVEDWLLNPTNEEGLTDSFLSTTLASDMQKWEDEAGNDIFGAGTTTTSILLADTSSPDGVNEVYFSNADPGTIAYTIVWGIFSGNPNNRELVEWDMVFDQEEFDWSSTGEAGKMDFENIATHEVGHAAGMDHPEDTCTEETMYAFASLGETQKRDLNAGDIEGILSLYT